MGYNKIITNGKTVLDLTEDSVTADTLAQGLSAHDAAGNKIIGTAFGATLSAEETEDGVAFTATDKNGTTSAAVKNGKSAYAYAQDGGYTGTEEEFAQKLAGESDGTVEVDTTLTQEGKAADAKAVGDTLAAKAKQPLNLSAAGFSTSESLPLNTKSESTGKYYTVAEIHEESKVRQIILRTTVSSLGTGSVQKGIFRYCTAFVLSGTAQYVEFVGHYENSDGKWVPAVAKIETNATTNSAEVTITDAEWAGSSSDSTSGGTSINVTAEVGQTIVVREADANGKPTAWEAAEYQPKTHWSETVITEILPETTIAIDSEGAGRCEDSIGLTAGINYTVKWNGTEYNCTAQDCFIPIDEEGNMANIGVALGNMGLATGGESTGEPFVIIEFSPLYAEEAGVPVGINVFDGSESAVLSITGEGEIVHKLNGKFMPTGTPYMEPFHDVILEETNLADALVGEEDGSHIYYYNLPIGNIVVGNIYDITFDGVTYQTKAYPIIDSSMVGIPYALGSGCVTYYDSSINEINTIATPGVPYNNAPFTLKIVGSTLMAETGVSVILIWAGPMPPERISIRSAYKVNEINMNCLPDNSVPLVVMVERNGTTYSTDYAWQEAYCAALCGRPVSMKVQAPGAVAFQIYSLTDCPDYGILNFERTCKDKFSNAWIADQIIWDLNDGITNERVKITTA